MKAKEHLRSIASRAFELIAFVSTLFYLSILTEPALIFAQTTPADSIRFQLGTQAFEEKRYGDAEEIFLQIIETDRKNADAYFMLSRVYLFAEEDLEAEKMIALSLRYDRDNVRFMESQYKIGFPSLKSQADRELFLRRVVQRIHAIDPAHALVDAVHGYDSAQIYLHNRGRISIPELRPYKTTLIQRGRKSSLTGDFSRRRDRDVDQELAQSPDPFDVEGLKMRGYTVQNRSSQADKNYKSAVDRLSSALLSDPTLHEVYSTLFAVHAAHEDTKELLDLTAAMRRHFPNDPYSSIYSGYAFYMAGRLNDADYYFRRGLDTVSVEDRSVFFDINRILNKKQRKQLGDDVQVFPEEFWTSRDPRYMSAQNERELEHYSRLVYSDLLFSEPSLGLRGWDSDRGNTYVRFGRPDTTFFMTNMVADCSEREGSLYMNAITNFHVFDYRIFRFVFGAAGNLGDSDFASNALVPASNEFALYSQCSDVRSFIDAYGSDFDYVERSEKIIEQVPDLFDYSPSPIRVQAPYQASMFKGMGDVHDVYITFGVPISFDTEESSISSDIEAGAFLVSTTEGRVAQNRLSAGIVDVEKLTSIGGSPYWTATHRLFPAPGQYTLSVEFESRSSNAVGYERAKVTVPDFSSDQFMMSDLVMAHLVEEIAPDDQVPFGSMVRDNIYIQPVIRSQYLRSELIYFYFELYNLMKGPGGRTEYEVEAILVEEEEDLDMMNRIQQVFLRKDQVGVSVSMNGSGSVSDESHYLILDAQDQASGSYILAVRVSDNISGQTVVTYRPLALE